MNTLTLREIVDQVMALAKEKGFGTTSDEVNVAEKFALIHTEVSEAYEAYRKKNMDGKDGVAEELGDIVLRVAHLSGVLGIDLSEAIRKKLEYNKTREWKWDAINETHR